MDVMEAAAKLERAGRRVLHMEVGQPSTPAPRTAIEAAARGLKDDVLGYTVAEIAQTASLPLETVRSRLRLAKQALRKRVLGNPRLREAVDQELETEAKA